MADDNSSLSASPRKLGRFPAIKLLTTDPTKSALTEMILDAVEHTGAAAEPKASNDRTRDAENSWIKLYDNLFHEESGLFHSTIQPPRDVSTLKVKIGQLWDDFSEMKEIKDEKLIELRERALAQKREYDKCVEACVKAREALADKKATVQEKIAAVEATYGERPAGCRGTAKAGGRPFASTNMKLHQDPEAFRQHLEQPPKKKLKGDDPVVLDNDRPIANMQKCLDELKEFQKTFTQTVAEFKVGRKKENADLAAAISSACASACASAFQSAIHHRHHGTGGAPQSNYSSTSSTESD